MSELEPEKVTDDARPDGAAQQPDGAAQQPAAACGYRAGNSALLDHGQEPALASESPAVAEWADLAESPALAESADLAESPAVAESADLTESSDVAESKDLAESAPAAELPGEASSPVAAALDELGGLAEQPVADHPGIYGRVHAQLQSALSAIDDA